jgi:hypothetical protein
VQREYVGAAQHRTVGFRNVDESGEHFTSAFERFVKRDLLTPERALDPRYGSTQFGIAVFERTHDGRNERRHEPARISEQFAVTYRAADEKTQHVAAVGIRRQHAVREEKRDRARVVGDNVAPHDALRSR